VQLFLFVEWDMQTKSKHSPSRVVSGASRSLLGQHDAKVDFYIANSRIETRLSATASSMQLATFTDRKYRQPIPIACNRFQRS